MSTRTGRRARRGLPLFWKLLLPVVVMVLVVGPLVTFVVVRDVASRTQAEVDQDLLTASLDVRARLHERELRLLEAGSLAANLQGMSEAIAARDEGTAVELLRSVVALRPDLRTVSVATADGQVLARVGDSTADPEGRVTELVLGPHRAALLPHVGGATLAVTTPVCAPNGSCPTVGHVVVEVDVADLLTTVSTGISGPVGVALHDLDGVTLSADPTVPDVLTGPPPAGVRRHEIDTHDGPAAVATAPWTAQSQVLGSVSVVVPTADATQFAAATARRLALVLLLAMAGVVALAGLIARSVLGQVRDLLATSRALGAGDLGARAPVVARDEIGELAAVLNAMADELRSSHETLERRVEERTAQVERLLRERTDFFAALSHELRTPLAVILSQARMRLDPAYGRRSGTKAWRTVADTGEQLLQTVNVILELARAQSGRLDLHEEDVDVVAAARAVTDRLSPLARTADVRLRVVEAPEPVLARADVQRVEQIITNLVDNAIKYTPSGGAVEVAIDEDLGHVCLAVTDDGPGIPADATDRVYEPFFRIPGVTPERGAPSTGLGLAMSRSLASAMGGSLSHVPAPGRGTRFTMRLRASDAEPAGQPTPTPATNRRTLATDSRNVSADTVAVGSGAARTTARP